MKSYHGAAFVASLLSPQVLAASPANPFSNYFSIGFAENGPFIKEVTTTLVLPPINPTQKGFLKIYPEVYTNATASLTGTAININDDRNPCPNNIEDWCVGARLVLGNAQNSGEYAPAPIGSKLGIKVTYDAATAKHDHTISVDGKVVSTLPVTSEYNLVAGRGIGFRTQIECQLDSCGAVASHEYINTKIILEKADLTFGKTADAKNAKGVWTTIDGGVTWTVDKIIVMSYTYE